MKKKLTKEWKQLQADTMSFLGKFGEKLVSLDTKAMGAPIICIRNHKEGYTRAFRISAYNGGGVFYVDTKNILRFVAWKKVREWNVYSFIEEVFKKNKDAVLIQKRYDSLCEETRSGFENHIEKNGGGYYDGKLQLRFVIEERLMKLHRTGSWGVMLEDKNGELYEDDFTGLDMGSRCKLVEFLAA